MTSATESEDTLLDYNEEKILANLLAIEEHMREEGLNQIDCDTWCAKKHYLLTKDHHLDEAISHSDDEIRDGFKRFRKELKDWHEDDKSIEGIRQLRNRFRELSEDETLHVVCEDGVCHKDIEGIEGEDTDKGRKKEEIIETGKIDLLKPVTEKIKRAEE